MTMSDPQRPPGKTPPRAEPLQPDKPGAGDGRQPGDLGRGRAERDDDPAEARRVQEKNAIDNNREGFGG